MPKEISEIEKVIIDAYIKELVDILGTNDNMAISINLKILRRQELKKRNLTFPRA